MQYQGGFLGWRAIADAFNPWDIVKAIGRSFRWLFIGRKHRKGDSSYEYAARVASQDRNGSTAGTSSKLDDDYARQQAYAPPIPPDGKAPPYSDAAGSNLELRPTHTHGSDSEHDYTDNAGLLSHAQADPSSSYPPRNNNAPIHAGEAIPYPSSDDAFAYPNAPPSVNYPPPSSAYPPPSSTYNAPTEPSPHPFAGVTQPNQSAENARPPPRQRQEDWDIWNGGAGAGLESPREWHGGAGPGAGKPGF